MDIKRVVIVVGCIVLVGALVLGIWNAALKRTVRRIEMTPERIDSIHEYGKLRFDDDDYARARRAFDIVAREKESTPAQREDALLKLAQISEREQDLEKAKEQYRDFIETFPGSPQVAAAQLAFENITMRMLYSPTSLEGSVLYEVQPNDTLGKIAAAYHTTPALIRKCNNLKNDIIIPGRKLKIVTARFSLLIDKSQNVLFLKRNDEIIKTYRVSTGANNSTPVGTFVIEEKLISPAWYKVGAVVSADSDEYELGTRWMGLSVEGYGIHGTRDPKTIGKQITLGCVRMKNAEVEELYDIVPSGTEVVIVN